MLLPKLDTNCNEDISKHLKTDNKIAHNEESRQLIPIKTKFNNLNINLANKKAYEENKTFVALARERKFKVYFSSKEEAPKNNLNKNLNKKDKKETHVKTNELLPIYKSLRVNKISDFENQSLLNASDLSLVKNLNNNKSKVFLTGRENEYFKNEIKSNLKTNCKSYKSIRDLDLNDFKDLNDIKDLNSNTELKLKHDNDIDSGVQTSNFQNYSKHVQSLIDNSNYEKYLFDKEEEQIYNKISVVPILQKMNPSGTKKSPTIDPDFFLKHSERAINKSLCVNFNTNPGLKKSFRKNTKLNMTSLGPEYFLKKKQEEEIEFKRRIKNVYYRNNQFDTTLFNKFRSPDTRSNDLLYNHFIFNSQPQTETIKDIKMTKPSRLANKNKEIKAEEKEKLLARGLIYEGMIKEIQDSKEKLLEGIESTMRLTDSDCLRNTLNTNEPGFLDYEERNVLGIITQPSIFKKSENDNGMVRVYQHPKHYRPAKPKKESQDDLQEMKIKKNTSKYTVSPKISANMNDHPVYKPKKEVENDLLMKKMKTHDKKLTSILNKIYEPSVVESTLLGSGYLKDKKLEQII